MARANAASHQLDVTFHIGDLGTPVSGPFAVVVANLPYIAHDELWMCSAELDFEPEVALFGGKDGLDLIRRLVADAKRLCTGGVMWLEHGFQQGAAIAGISSQLGCTSTLLKDGSGKDRFTRICP